MIFLIDNSVYKKKSNLNLYRVLKRHNLSFVKISSIEKLEYYLKKYNPKKFILSGSPIMFSERDYYRHIEYFFLNYFVLKNFSGKIPIFGICFGAQFINLYFGGELEKLESKFCMDLNIEDKKLFFCLNYKIKKLSKYFRVNYYIPKLE